MNAPISVNNASAIDFVFLDNKVNSPIPANGTARAALVPDSKSPNPAAIDTIM